jgi:hypothetical protein
MKNSLYKIKLTKKVRGEVRETPSASFNPYLLFILPSVLPDALQ